MFFINLRKLFEKDSDYTNEEQCLRKKKRKLCFRVTLKT